VNPLGDSEREEEFSGIVPSCIAFLGSVQF